MENPTFRLEGVVRTRDELEDFEGPLALILQLLAKNKIEIQDIKIAELLDQYMAWIDEMKAMDLEVASEFVQMASHLVYIKARMLLSAGEETDELEELISSLERLQNRDVFDRVRLILPSLSQMYTRGAGTVVKPPEYLPPDKEYRYEHDRSDLLEAMARVMSREDGARLVQDAGAFRFPEKIVYSVTEKTNELLAKLKRRGAAVLDELFGECASRSELVATFIALLEICRDGRARLDGDGGGLTVSYVKEEE